MTTIICPSGTSAAKLLIRRIQQPLAKWIEERGEDSAVAEIFASFADIPPEGDDLQKRLSAEIHSLARMNLESGDRVLLLSSATRDGAACAKAVAKYLEKYWPDTSVCAPEQLEGLQVRDAELFRRQGVPNFLRRCIREINQYGRDNVVLNPTAGFKALVPYTVLMGMLFQVPCRYVFEQSTTLMELPNLPVEFKRGDFSIQRRLFEKIERDSFVSLEEWQSAIPFDRRNLMHPLFEFHDQSVTLSDIGFLLWESVRNPAELVPFLSRKAYRDCVKMVQNRNPFNYLSNVARRSTNGSLSPRDAHKPVNDGLIWLKPGDTTDRYLVSIEDWRLLVWRVIREDQEGGNYVNSVTVDPNRERSRFAPFVRMEFVE